MPFLGFGGISLPEMDLLYDEVFKQLFNLERGEFEQSKNLNARGLPGVRCPSYDRFDW